MKSDTLIIAQERTPVNSRAMSLRDQFKQRITFDVTVPLPARFLYFALDQWAQEDGITKTLKAPEMAALLGASERGIRDWLRILEAKGYIRGKRGRRGYHFELSWSEPTADQTACDRQQMPIIPSHDRQQAPITETCDRQQAPITASRPAANADHAVYDRQQMPITAPQSMPCPDGQVLRQRTYVRTEQVLNSEERQVIEIVRSWLSDYPGVTALRGQPDDEIVRQCLDIAEWDTAGIRSALEDLSHKRSRPTKSWAWFPAVFRKMAAGAQAVSA